MAGRPKQRRELAVWLNDQRVGRWSISPAGGPAFAYEASWLDAPQSRPLSLSLPLVRGTRPFRGAAVESFFDQLLPASPMVRLRLQSQGGCASPSAFDLLSTWGSDCVGAVSLLGPVAQPGAMTEVNAEPLADADVARLLDACCAAPDAPRGAGIDPVRALLPGGQPKLALLWHAGRWCRPREATPTTHVLKLPLGAAPGSAAGHHTSLANEWLCGRLLAAFGFDTVPARLDVIGGHRVLVSERYDRRFVDARWWARLPAESLAQALASRAGEPGFAAMLGLLRGAEQPARDRERLFMTRLVFWMLAAVDRSARHVAVLLKPGGRCALAPLCGVMSAWPLVGRSPSVASLDRLRFAQPPAGAGTPPAYTGLTRAIWLQAAKANALGRDIVSVIDGLTAWTERAIDAVADGLPPDFPLSVSEPVFAGLRRSARRLIP
jgi:serine/threonine-protein kinase HipA